MLFYVHAKYLVCPVAHVYSTQNVYGKCTIMNKQTKSYTVYNLQTKKRLTFFHISYD